jgi:nucleotide-binding universal stress UspA family protein
MSVQRRRAYEPGHKPKFLAIVDETPECGRALRFAARRAARIGSGVVLLAVAEPAAEFRDWPGVGATMEAEALAEAEQRLETASADVRAVAGLEPERVTRVGQRAEEVLKLIEADEDVALLVLAAGDGPEGPGPLVSALAGRNAGRFPIPIAIVPGHLDDADIDALA